MPLPLAGQWPFVPLIVNVKVSIGKSPSWRQLGAGVLREIIFHILALFSYFPRHSIWCCQKFDPGRQNFSLMQQLFLGHKILIYCVLLHNSLFCPRAVLLILLSFWLYNSNFFNFPSKDRASHLHPLNSPLHAPCLPGDTLLTAEHRAAAGPPAALGTTEGLVLTSCRTSYLFTPGVCALLHSGSAPLTHAALWFTVAHPLQSCCPDTHCRARAVQLAVPTPVKGNASVSACSWVQLVRVCLNSQSPVQPRETWPEERRVGRECRKINWVCSSNSKFVCRSPSMQ